ncbi:MAG: pro-sigmaK processing inhibitor BofA family protein [Bacilli bacterium]|nr:pro-sigmaK processing inhibitor BofA family protein [Bacilli bacterium]
MKNVVIVLVKRLCIGLVFLYSLNLILNDLDIMLPINLFSILISTFLGIPGVIALLLLNIFII